MSTPEQKAKALAYYYANRERILERYRKRYAEDAEWREQRLANSKEWQAKHPEQNYWNHKLWRDNNRDKLNEIQRKWCKENREKRNEYQRKWYAKRKEQKQCSSSSCSAE